MASQFFLWPITFLAYCQQTSVYIGSLKALDSVLSVCVIIIRKANNPFHSVPIILNYFMANGKKISDKKNYV